MNSPLCWRGGRWGLGLALALGLSGVARAQEVVYPSLPPTVVTSQPVVPFGRVVVLAYQEDGRLVPIEQPPASPPAAGASATAPKPTAEPVEDPNANPYRYSRSMYDDGYVPMSATLLVRPENPHPWNPCRFYVPVYPYGSPWMIR